MRVLRDLMIFLGVLALVALWTVRAIDAGIEKGLVQGLSYCGGE